MFPRFAPILLIASICLAAPLHARAEVYKWVDERGVVNYGDAPPPRAKGVRPLDLEPGTAGVLPGIPKEELERLRERGTRERLQQLEAEVEELRAREAEQAAAPTATPTEPRFYGYPAYWYGGTRPQRPGIGRPVHPANPIATPPQRQQPSAARRSR